MVVGKKILGLDNGYDFTKTSKHVRVSSTIKKGTDDVNDVIQVKVNGENYIVGDPDGAYIPDSDKLKNEENKEVLKVTTLTAIGLSYPDLQYIDVNLVVGVPVAFFSKQKDELKEFMQGLNEKITINSVGHEQHIRVREVLVFPQSAGVVFKLADTVSKESSLIIDVGGGTWDVSQFNGLRMEEKATYHEGMLVLYSTIAQFLNSEYYTNFQATEIYDLMQRGYFTVEGERIGTEVFSSLVEKHVNNVLAQIARKFDVINIDNIFVIGGGASEVFDLIQAKLPSAIELDDAQFVNADCFEIMGLLKLA